MNKKISTQKPLAFCVFLLLKTALLIIAFTQPLTAYAYEITPVQGIEEQSYNIDIKATLASTKSYKAGDFAYAILLSTPTNSATPTTSGLTAPLAYAEPTKVDTLIHSALSANASTSLPLALPPLGVSAVPTDLVYRATLAYSAPTKADILSTSAFPALACITASSRENCDCLTIPASALNGSLYLLSSFTTDYSKSSQNRKTNVELAAKSLNNAVLLPKDELSFNAVVGERSEERGYKAASVIIGGGYQEGIGGGVCQVSTTLYVAALLSGLKITESHPHSVPSSYVPPSMDATVGYGYFDLRLQNTTDGVLVIKTEAQNGKLTVSVYSTASPTVTVRLKSEITERIMPKEPIILDEKPKDAEGMPDENGDIVITSARIGIKSRLIAKYYQNDTLQKTVVIRNDYYRERPKTIIRPTLTITP